MEIKNIVASALLDTQAVKLQPQDPFTWASGWKSPIYCDNRKTLSYPLVRQQIRDAFIDLIYEKCPHIDAIAGVATAGIPQAAILADALNLPMLYIRSKAKGHGLTNRIEGKAFPGQNILVIEDLISTAGSSLSAVDALREEGFVVDHMMAVVTYGFDVAAKNVEEKNVQLHTLTDYNAIIEEAIRKNHISSDMVDTLSEWRKDPSVWGK